MAYIRSINNDFTCADMAKNYFDADKFHFLFISITKTDALWTLLNNLPIMHTVLSSISLLSQFAAAAHSFVALAAY
jgi:hypothetical protein